MAEGREVVRSVVQDLMALLEVLSTKHGGSKDVEDFKILFREKISVISRCIEVIGFSSEK
jgi:hypothetical protein